jgi:hypothetical protein
MCPPVLSQAFLWATIPWPHATAALEAFTIVLSGSQQSGQAGERGRRCSSCIAAGCWRAGSPCGRPGELEATIFTRGHTQDWARAPLQAAIVEQPPKREVDSWELGSAQSDYKTGCVT